MQREKRLFIERIVVEDFKSYKGVHTIGPFDRGFNAIVGPNGSGKSNVIDSVLFVLGFKAKRLRHAKAEDLIHTGEPRPQTSTVTIYFVDQNNSTLNVSRTVNLKGKSVYMLNGTAATIESISETLKLYNVDLVNNRFMILQGEIESISNMKAKGTPETPGLVEYLEEIVGTHQYIEEIKSQEAAHAIAAETAEKLRAEHRFVEKEAEYLRPKAEAAEAQIYSYAGALERKLQTLAADIATADEQVQAEKKALGRTHAKTEKLNHILAQHALTLKSTDTVFEEKKNAFRIGESEYLQAKKEYETANTQFLRGTDLQKMYTDKLAKLKQDLEHRAETQAHEEAQMKEAAEELGDNTKRIEEAQKERAELEQTLKALEGDSSAQLTKNLKDAEEALLAHMKKLKVAKDAFRAQQRQLGEIDKAGHTLKEMLAALPKEIAALKARKSPHSEEKFTKAQARALEIRKGREETVSECKKREAHLQDLQKELATLSTSDKLGTLLTIQGFFGRIRDLGTIPSAYTIALSATAKGSLNHLVVDTTATAEKCLDLIKAKNLGRHTILVLDKISKNIKPTTETNRLLDKIKTKPEFHPCFYHILGDTLVVNSMEAAMKRAFAPDRPKVVTLDGKVIDKSGLMSGGTIRPIYLSERRPPQELQKEISTTLVQVKEAKEGLGLINAALEKAEVKLEALTQLKKENDQTPHSLALLENKLAAAQQQLQNHHQTDARRTQLQNQAFELNNQITALTAQEAELDEKKYALEKALEKKLGAKYQALKAKAIGVVDQILALQERNSSLDKSLKKAPLSTTGITQEITETETLLAEIKIHPPETEELALAKKERELRDQKSAVQQIEEERALVQKEVDTHREQELLLFKDKTEREEFLLQYTTARNNASKDLAVLTEKEKILKTKLGSYQNTHTHPNQTPTPTSKSLPGTIDESSIDSLIDTFLTYQEKKDHLLRETRTLEDAQKKETTAKNTAVLLKERRVSEFIAGIKKINSDLKRIYNTLTFGGDAELEPVDYLDPFSEGMAMSVMPPRKSWRSISHLSGGERTLASLSLIFALHEYLPNSFYVMDEVDAALDYKNVGIVGRFITEKAAECQFLVISLRENMYELADVFVGVYRPAETTLSLVVRTGAGISS
ncbi:structural maintenance of chromosome 4 [Nematocida displodere]|uniref:Structural maintenance of chromosome 4 n=1 Tax=Nematocida displodere TaxID=1805483 RepID=A0A177ECJ2_9MICR|nr:structural maintenance of chromosome 4 [Nematocida displodere]